MKRFYLILLTVLAIMLPACDNYVEQYKWNKSKPEEEEEKDPEGYPVSKVFSATLSRGSFAADDAVTIFWGKSLVAKTEASPEAAGSSVQLNASVVEADNYWAVYPSTVSASYKGSSTLEVNIPTVQAGDEHSCNIEIAHSGSDLSFAFSEISARVKFTITRSDIAQVTLKGTGGERIAGAFLAAWSDGQFDITESTPSATVNFPSSAPADAVAPGDYYIALRGGVSLPDGFTLTCKDADGQPVVAPFVSEAAATVVGEEIDLGIVDQTGGGFSMDFFVTPAGAGEKSGADWENAMDAAAMREALGDPNKIEGYSFRLSGGTFVLPDATTPYIPIVFDAATDQVSVSIYGGYNPESTGKDVSLRDTKAFKTVFSGNDAYAGFSFGANTKFLFDGVTFTKFTTTEDTAAETLAVIRGAMASVANTASITLNDCAFKDNVENATSATGSQGGAALFITKGEVYVTNTVFTGNASGSRGGAIRNDGTGLLFMDSCAMVGNKITKDSYGMVMFARANTALNNCVMFGNTDDVDTKNNPCLNINYNTILTNTTVIDDSFFSTGTGVIRTEINSGNGYAGLIMNCIIVNTHPEDEDNVAWAILDNKNGLVSGGYNLLCAKDGAIGKATIPTQTTDKCINAIAEVGVTYTLDADNLKVNWSGDFNGYAPGSATAVRTAIAALAPTEGRTTIGSEFAAWLDSIGAFD